MSLLTVCLGVPTPGFPRVSGDEPGTIIQGSALRGFSPRERG